MDLIVDRNVGSQTGIIKLLSASRTRVVLVCGVSRHVVDQVTRLFICFSADGTRILSGLGLGLGLDRSRFGCGF